MEKGTPTLRFAAISHWFPVPSSFPVHVKNNQVASGATQRLDMAIGGSGIGPQPARPAVSGRPGVGTGVTVSTGRRPQAVSCRDVSESEAAGP